MGPECNYSFKDLYMAAYGANMSSEDIKQFSFLSQAERNVKVLEWARLAGWGTDDRLGSDGQLYTAFCPLWK